MGGGGVFLRGAFLKGPEGAFFRGGALKVGRKYRRTVGLLSWIIGFLFVCGVSCGSVDARYLSL